MNGIVFVGDEATAAGYRLCGARTLSPPLGAATEVLRQILGEAHSVVLVTPAHAAALPAEELRQALLHQRPPLMLVRSAVDRHGPADLATEVRRQLGLAG